MTETLRPVYEESSQYRHWRFSPSQLWDTRMASHEAAVERVRRNFQEDQVRANKHWFRKSSWSFFEQKESQAATPDELKYLSIEDELALCRFYEKQLQTICRHLKFPEVVMVKKKNTILMTHNG